MSPKSFILFSLFLVFLIQPVDAAGVTDDLGDGRYRVTQGQFVFEYEIDSGHGREYTPLCWNCDLPINFTYVSGPSEHTPFMLSSSMAFFFRGRSSGDELGFDFFESLDIGSEDVLVYEYGWLERVVCLGVNESGYPSCGNESYWGSTGNYSVERPVYTWSEGIHPSTQLRVGESIVLNFHGSRPVTMEPHSVDIVPYFNIGGTVMDFERLAWWNVSRTCRRQILASTTIPFYVNDTAGFNGQYLLTNNATSDDDWLRFGYSTDCVSAGGEAVANESLEVPWSNASTPGVGGSNPTQVFGNDTWYTFQDGIEGNDSGPNNNDCAAEGTVAANTTGRYGGGVHFETDGRMDCNNIGFAGQNLFTLLAWIYPDVIGTQAIDNPSTNQIIRFEDADEGGGVRLIWALTSNDEIGIFMATSTPDRIFTTSSPISTGAWQCVAIRQNDSHVGVFVDKAQVAVATMSVGSPTGAIELTIGADGDGSKPFVGNIHDVVISNRNWSDVEIGDYCDNGNDLLSSFGDAEELDVSAPNLTIDSPTNTTFTDTVDLNVFAADDNLEAVVYSLDGGANITITNSVNVTEVDMESGNASSGSVTSPELAFDEDWGTRAVLDDIADIVFENFSISIPPNTSINLDWVLKHQVSVGSSGGVPACWNYTSGSYTNLSNLINDSPPINITMTFDETHPCTNNNFQIRVSGPSSGSLQYFESLLNLSFNITVNGTFNTTLTGLSEGNHNVIVFANDTSGNTNSSQVFFTVDTTAPVVTIDLPLNITHFTDTLEVNASFSDTVPDVIFFSLDGGANSTGVSSPLNSSVTGLADGVHDVRVCANDTAGNEGCVSRFFTIQAGIAIVTPTNTTFLTPVVLLSVASNASVAQWNFSLDGGASNEFTPNITLVLASGAHNIMVFANLSASGVIRNATVFFTLNYTTSNITFQPPTPNNGTVIEAFDPFTIQANTSFGGSQPIVFFLRNGVSFGSFDLVFKENSTISSEYWMTIDTLTPGNYTYFAQTLIGGASFISAFRNFFITSPLFRESDGSTVFPTEFILVAYLSPPSPVSHDSVSSGGFRVEARAFNINGVVTSTIVEFLIPSGSSVGSSVLSFSNSSNNTWILFGGAVPPSGFTSLSYRVRVNDSSGRSGSSLDRLITVFVVGGGDIDFAGAIGTIEGTLGVSRGSPERNFGRVMLSLGAIGIMVSGAFGTPLGLTGALPLGVTGIILMARSGDIPVYLGVLGVLLTAGIGVKLFLDMLPSSGEKL